ncbi:TraB/GumN family protein [Flavobacterium flavipallidum]|uniref:TraB/GumN family protein n=1 Tax=Flavobacterium flavipallidum TaxID=3139140 RepID=A0ABU9HKG1_9FLAO
MEKFLKSVLISSLVLVVNIGFAQVDKNENSLLWKISGNGLQKPSYLFGTIHMMCENDFVIKEKVIKAFDQTEELALELDFDDPLELQNMQKLAVASTPLSRTLTKEEYSKLEAILKNSFSLNIKDYENYNLIGLLSVVLMKELNCPPKMYEFEFLKMGMQRKSIIHGMEKVDDQIKAFANAYDNNEFIEQLELYDSTHFNELVGIYKNEDINKLFSLSTDKKYMNKEVQNFMLDSRNKKWVTEMPEMMQQHSIFFAVGAAHLPGDNGVINLLRQAGYTVTSIKN